MNIAAGTLVPDSRHDHGGRADGRLAQPAGGGRPRDRDRPPAPGRAAGPDRAGEPAGRPAGQSSSGPVPRRTWRTRLLDHVGLRVDPRDRVETLTVAAAAPAGDRQGLRGRPDAADPGRAHRAAERGGGRRCSSGCVREQVAAGTSVVYITHRLAEVRELADRVTVLRDGRVRGTARVERDHRPGAARPDPRPAARTRPSRRSTRADGRATRSPAARRTWPGPASPGCPPRPARARSSAWPASSATGRAACCAHWPGWSRSPGRSAVGERELSGRDLLRRGRVHARRPAGARACMIEPDRTGEHGGGGAEPVRPRRPGRPGAGARRRDRVAVVAVGPGARRWRRRSRRCPAATSRRW